MPGKSGEINISYRLRIVSELVIKLRAIFQTVVAPAQAQCPALAELNHIAGVQTKGVDIGLRHLIRVDYRRAGQLVCFADIAPVYRRVFYFALFNRRAVKPLLLQGISEYLFVQSYGQL